MSYRPPFIDPHSKLVDGPHPAQLDEATLLRGCTLSTGRVSGPGGQHRNRVETAVFITHAATGIEAQGTERRSQVENRRVALRRLRLRLAIHVRTLATRDGYAPTALWTSRLRGTTIQVSATHHDYPAILAEALDVLVAHHFDHARAAVALGLTASQLAKLILREKDAIAYIARGRAEAGLRPLRHN
jgi:hypothetical protein